MPKYPKIRIFNTPNPSTTPETIITTFTITTTPPRTNCHSQCPASSVRNHLMYNFSFRNHWSEVVLLGLIIYLNFRVFPFPIALQIIFLNKILPLTLTHL